MLTKTQGIVLNYFKYKDSSIISKIYTRELGLQSYIQNGALGGKGNKISFFQTLNLLELVVYSKHERHIHRISELKCAFFYKDIGIRPYKSLAVGLMSEVLLKCIREEEQNTALFDYLWAFLIRFDASESESGHLDFLMDLSRHLGFGPENAEELTSNLDAHWIGRLRQNVELQESIGRLMDGKSFDIPRKHMADMLDLLISFYQLHIPSFGELRTLSVLRVL